MPPSTPHKIVLTIAPDGSVQMEVKGVTGKKCTDLSKWVDQLGQVTEDRHTADYNKPESQQSIRTGQS